MKPANQKRLSEAVDAYQNKVIDLLVKGSTKSHIDGGVIGQTRLSMGISFDLVKQEALDYGQQYKKDMVERGGSYVYDKDLDQTVFKPWMKDHSEELRGGLADIITNGIAEGKSMPEVAQELEEVTGKEYSWCEGVARSETGRAQWAGSKSQYRNADVEEVQWANGPNPCEYCESLHGRRFKLDDVPDYPHNRCTCDIIPVVS
jgi:SPP1 gp7 family putative phage head morphogenesis protein